ncbi:NADP-dependent oxidoreductase [Mycolicibacterium mageritense]|uniref:NADP-dependent oxidoreductase n=1 Tax=Mycolicibacterium mageritense TaxID=53462 RepID=A0AAI8TQ55_MYCME|nr:NADP-dependent oxidoreductase [Mycolicibacterium mageritense]MCC9179679.1 NADP-dependent oxidoreductase [Mycolicibacterium mageritense]BBX32468.1 NADP-dependent oxidoreductase [Mycolicibacterium mageritense]BDY28863.1 Putative NADP-dependent oxidoreductase YfmJ [Mycolicibacterium mageritense]CDO22991.1 putative NADP-dependent oxidoreductase [Mycolicibacterium mageritense DSM 44476 = CIP 104973]
MTHTQNRRMLLTSRPVWTLKQSDFTVDTTPVPEPGPCEVIVKVLWLAFDPAQRGWMNDGPSYAPPVALGDVMRAHAVGEVVESADAEFPVGTLVHGNFGWQDYAVCATAAGTIGTLEHVSGNTGTLPRAHKVPEGIAPTAALGVLGTTGLTAYFGMVEIGHVRPGDVVLVSGAAGATGSVAGQIARLGGAHTIGLAGGPDKARWLTETARFDAAIDYKVEDVVDRIAELAPHGVNLFYDNVAGKILEAGIRNIAQRGRVVLCGGISSGYSDEATAYGPTNLSTITVRSASMAGFIVTDFLDRFDEAAHRLAEWIRNGDIVWAEDIQKGTVDDAVDTLNRLFAGKNFGKQLLQIAEPTGGNS